VAEVEIAQFLEQGLQDRRWLAFAHGNQIDDAPKRKICQGNNRNAFSRRGPLRKNAKPMTTCDHGERPFVTVASMTVPRLQRVLHRSPKDRSVAKLAGGTNDLGFTGKFAQPDGLLPGKFMRLGNCNDHALFEQGPVVQIRTRIDTGPRVDRRVDIEGKQALFEFAGATVDQLESHFRVEIAESPKEADHALRNDCRHDTERNLPRVR